VALILGVNVTAHAKIIKFATVVPDGAPGYAEMRKMLTDLATDTGGEVNIQVYGAGVAGDELDVIRKMRAGRIHMGAFSSVGIAQILPKMRVLEAPGIFNNYAEADYVREKMFDEFAADFLKQGYTLLSIGEAGFGYFYSVHNMTGPEGFKPMKMWTWKGDIYMQKVMESFGMTAVPLHIADVNVGLQTGMIDSFSGPPMIITAFQWYPNAKYMLDYPITDLMGVILMNKTTFDSLSPKSKTTIQDYIRKNAKEGMEVIRKLNADSLPVLKEYGIKFLVPTPEQVAQYQNYFKVNVDFNIKQGAYSRELYDKVSKLVSEYRAANPQ
jgi:TRAP-type C4-dicarboxylate transport system substrate-binding protein